MKTVLAVLALVTVGSLGSTWWLWQKLTASEETAAQLRSSVQVLEQSQARSSLAIAKQRRQLEAAERNRAAAAQALERALAASPDWAAMPVPQEVQDAR